MPVLTSCKARSPPAVESPPRKKFKLSLKLKTKKKNKTTNLMSSDSEHDSGEENCDSVVNCGRKEVLNGSLTKSTNSMTDANTTFGLQCDDVSPPLPYTGLANLGNTCYLNAVVQVLRYCPGFLKSLVNLDEISAKNCLASNDLTKESDSLSDEDLPCSKRPSIIHNIHKLTNMMETAEENYNKFGVEAGEVKVRSGWTTLAVRPQDFVNDFSGLCPLFSGYQQHDAQEFLRSFLSLVEEECIGLVKGEQQENTKGNSSITNNKSKVRGGCKYPSTNSVAMETEEKPAMMVLTDESVRVSVDIEVSLNDTAVPASPTTKSVQKVAGPENENVVKELFEGKLLLQTCCLNCEGVRQRYENFQDISVPVQNTKSQNSEGNGNKLSDSEDECDENLNLSWAISKFASIERLNGDNKYFCDNCATLTEADISTYFEKLPQVLTIHLKRFQTSYGNQSLYTSSWVTKVTKSLHTPQRLSLKKWCSATCTEKNATYSLFGVVMHSGMSSCSGHYLSYVNVDVLQNQDDGRRNGTSNGFSAQCEAVRKNENVDVEVPRKIAGENCQDCQGVNSATQSDNVTSDHRNTFAKHGILSMCDEESKSERAAGENVEDNKDLCCDETLAMDLGREDTCDYSERDNVETTMCDTRQEKDTDDMKERRNSDTQLRRKTPLRNCRRNTTESDIDFESSSDEEETVIPSSMNITRYFKPIPKKSCNNIKPVETRSESSKVKSNGKDEKDSCPQTNVENGLRPGDVQKSQGSAFTAFRKRVRSDAESLREENSQKKSSTDIPESFELLLDMEPSDKVCSTNDLDTHTGHGFTEKCSNGTTNNVASLNTLGPHALRSTWLKFDDAEVQEISAKDMEAILSPSSSCYSTPYLLFYHRC